MRAKLISENKTEVMFSKKSEKDLIDQLKFFGATPTKESKTYIYFEFDGDIGVTMRNLGFS